MVEVWPLVQRQKKKKEKRKLASRLVNNIFIIYSDHEYRMLPLVDGYLVLVSTVFISGEEGRGRLTVVRNKLFYTV